MRASTSRSSTWLSAPPAIATSAVPTNACASRTPSILPGLPSTKPAAQVTATIPAIRLLTSSARSAASARTRPRAVPSGTAPAGEEGGTPIGSLDRGWLIGVIRVRGGLRPVAAATRQSSPKTSALGFFAGLAGRLRLGSAFVGGSCA
jgi:hypothetical protein